jgi:DNA-binding CsgD family transcriptional regulator
VHEGPGGMVSPVFVGRAPELARLRAALGQAAIGAAQTIVVGGEAGVGKTRLVDELAREAEEAGHLVVSGRCVQVGVDGLPFAPLVEALRALVRGPGRTRVEEVGAPANALLERLLPTAGAAGPSLTSSQLLELVLDLLEELATSAPVLLVIEDLQWADASTRDLVAFLSRNLRGVPVALLVTYRSDEVGRQHPLRGLLSEWERNRDTTHVQLARFDRAEVRAQLTAILGEAPAPAVLDVVYERSEGNAFLAEEMLSLVRSGDPDALPPSLRDVLLARVDLLSPDAQRTLQVAAAAGRSVPERLLVAVSALAEVDALAALRECVEAHLLVVGADDGYAFRHALVRDATYDDLLPGERVLLHSAYVDTLARQPELLDGATVSPAASLAHHAYAALDLTRALHASVTAGNEALARVAPHEALAHFERALLVWPRVRPEDRPDDTDQAELLARAGRAAYHAGELDRSASLLEEAASQLPEDAPMARRVEVTLGLARTHLAGARLDAARDVLSELVDDLPAEEPSTDRAETLAALAGVLVRLGELVQAGELAREASGLAAAVGADAIAADAQITLGATYTLRGRVEEGETETRAGLELALRSGEVHTALRGYINLTDQLESQGRSAEVIETAKPGIELAARSGMRRSFGAFLHGNLAESLMHSGGWDQARALIAAALDWRPEGVFEATLQLMDAELSLLTGDLDRARHAMVRAEATADRSDPQYALPQAALEVELLRETREYAAGAAVGAAALAAATGAHEELHWRYAWPLLWSALRSAVDAVLVGEAASVPAPLSDQVESWPTGSQLTDGYRLLCRAELDRLSGNAEWAEAGVAWAGIGWPWPQAYTLLREAEAAAERGETDAALAPLRRSWRMASDLGAVPLLQEAEQLARRSRIALQEGDDRSEADPLGGLKLTGREREVLLLLAEGRSNPEIARELFISPKTASVHVSNILTKLGLSSRVQAAAVVHRLAPPEP